MIAFTTPKIAPTISSVTILRPKPASPFETTTPGTTAVATQMATALTTTLISREPTGRILPRTVATWGGATVRLDHIVLRGTPGVRGAPGWARPGSPGPLRPFGSLRPLARP